MFEFKIQGRLPGLNEYVKQNRGKSGIFFGNKVKQSLTDYVTEQISEMDHPEFKGMVHVSFLWVEPNYKRDPDNFAFAKKFLLDGMVKSGLIVNDTHKYISGFSDRWEVRPETNGGVIVTVEEVSSVQ